MTKNAATKAPAKPRANIKAEALVKDADATPVEAAPEPKLILSLHHRIDMNDDGRG